jgi:hypothetical protein
VGRCGFAREDRAIQDVCREAKPGVENLAAFSAAAPGRIGQEADFAKDICIRRFRRAAGQRLAKRRAAWHNEIARV